jgi:competence protein ComEC
MARNLKPKDYMSDTIYFRPVIPLLLALIAGIVLGSWIPGHRLQTGFIISLCVVLIVFFILKQKDALLLPLILFAAVGYLSIQPWLIPKLPSNHIVHFRDTHPWEIVGVIDNRPVASRSRFKFILRTETLSAKKTSFAVTGKIRVTVSGNIPRLFRGDRVALVSKIRSIQNFKNPGGFDYKRYMAFKGVRASAYVAGERLTIRKRRIKKGLGRLIDDARSSICSLIEKAGSTESQGVLKALIVGDRDSIPPALREAFNRAGVGHLLAISGLHIGIVATWAFFSLAWLLSYCKPLLRHAWSKKAAVVLSMIPVFAYGLLAGMSPSTQRAVIMVTIFLLTFLFEREHDLVNTLALAAMLILIIDPPALFSISFQLSFAAVLVIIYSLSRVPNPWLSDQNRMLKPKFLLIKQKLFSFFAASFFAITGTIPLLMLYFNQVSLAGFFVNIIIVPLIGFMVVPLGLLAVFLYPLSAFGASVFLKTGAAVLSPALGIVKFFAKLPYAAVKTVTPTYFEIGLYYLLFWALLNFKRMRPTLAAEQNLPDAEKRTRRMFMGKELFRTAARHKIARIIVAIVIIAAIADTFYWMHQRFWHADLRVTVIDVGHGSSALLELPEGYNIMIDGGGFSDNAIFDIGARIVAPLLWRKKIKSIETLILSHPNSDHLNGLIYIAENFNVKEVWTNNQAAGTIGYDKFMTAIEKNNIRLPAFKTLPRLHAINGVRLELLHPPVDFAKKSKREWWRDLNNNSLVIKVTLGSKSFLFPGDIKARAETELIAATGDHLSSTILIAPHHGSKTSSSGVFLDRVNPDVVIISSGWKSRFGFPHQPVLDRYKQRGAHIFETARHGAVTMTTDGRSITIKSAITDENQHIPQKRGIEGLKIEILTF